MRVSETQEQIVSRQMQNESQNMKVMTSLRASETHAQTLQKQADSRKHMAILSYKRLNYNLGLCVKQTFHTATKFTSKITNAAVSHFVCLRIRVYFNHVTLLLTSAG